MNSSPKYSICMTCFNEAETAKDSLNSLLGQLNINHEVVIVDNFSKDGTYEILKEFETSRAVKVIQRKCSLGMGRQIAFENSSGEYIISNLDLDDVFEPSLGKLLEFYQVNCDGKLLLALGAPPERKVWLPNVTIGSRELIRKLGGWRDLQIGEDWDLWCRASKAGVFRTTAFPIARHVGSRQESSFQKVRRRFVSYRDHLRLGRPVLSPGEHLSGVQRATLILARLSNQFGSSYADEYNSTFDPYDTKYFIGNATSSGN